MAARAGHPETGKQVVAGYATITVQFQPFGRVKVVAEACQEGVGGRGS